MTMSTSRPLVSLVAATHRSATVQAGVALRLGAPAAMVIATLLVADLVRWVFAGGGVFLLLLLPVLVASIVLGAVSGLVALGLGAVGALLIVVLRGHPWLTEPTDLLRVVPYLFLGSAIVLVASVLRTELRRRPRDHRVPSSTSLIEPLTPRETEVLGLAASGLSTSQIADRLCLSSNTVKSHLAHAYGKLGAHNRAEAVAAGLHARAIRVAAVTSRAPEITDPVTVVARRLDGRG